MEDGKPQKVDAFSFINIPVERQARPLFAKAPIERDVADNITGYDGRVYIILLDDQHTHPLRSQRLKAAARQFVQRYMGANDTAAVVYTSGRSDVAQEFTNSQRRLLASVDKFMGRKLRSSTLERLDEEQRTRGTRQQGDRIDDPFDQERAMVARTTLDSLRNLSNYLAGISGRRKAIIYFSEGVDYDIYDVFSTSGGASAVLQASRDAVAAATRANVSIYGIDPRGLGAGSDDLIEVQDTPQDASLNLGLSSFGNEVQRSQDSLRVLSNETGGFAVVNRNDMATAFERVVADNSAYYLLGYYSSNEKRDGRFRKIEVKVTRPGLSVRSRKGYVAARGRADNKDDGRTAPELRAALSSPLPTTALPLAMAAAVFKGGDGKGAVVISTLMAARDLELVEKDGTFNNNLEVVVTAADYGGKSFPGDRATLTLALKPDSVQRLRAGGFRILNAIDLPPGRYQLRVAAREANTKRAGSVDLRPRRAGLLQGEALDQRPGAHLGHQRAHSHGPPEGPAGQDAARADDHLPRLRAGRRAGALCRDLRQHETGAQGRHRGQPARRRRPGRVPDPRRARQQRTGRRTGRLRLHGAGAAQGRAAGPLRVARVGEDAHRRPGGSGARDHPAGGGAANALSPNRRTHATRTDERPADALHSRAVARTRTRWLFLGRRGG